MKNRILPLLLGITVIAQSVPVVAEEIEIIEQAPYETLYSTNEYAATDLDDSEEIEEELNTLSEDEQDNISDNSVELETLSDYTDIPEYDTVLEDIDYGFPSECAGTFAAKYDPRPLGKVSSVKTQVNGSCWLYSAMSTVESNLIKNGLANSSVDLSELHALYFMHKEYDDPLGNYSNDARSDGLNLSYAINHGSDRDVYSFFSKWNGPVYENEAPLSLVDNGNIPTEYLNTVSFDKSFANKNYWHFEGSRYCNYDVDHINNVKDLITTYGGVSAAYYNAPAYYKATQNGGDASYYWGRKTSATHAIEIVGWDDNYSKDNFATKPSADGAWLIKNSHGNPTVNGYQTSGYFWMSYYEPSLCDISAVNFTSKYLYENMYAYDGKNRGIGSGSFPNELTAETISEEVLTETLTEFEKMDIYTNATTVFNIYKANAYETNSVERIDAIMMVIGANSNYKITIYINPEIIGTKLVGYSGKSSTTTGKTTYSGYYTIPLSEPAYVSNGDTFAVCIEAPDTVNNGCSIIEQSSNSPTTGKCYFFTDFDNMIDSKWVSEYMGTTLTAPSARALTNKADYFTFASSLTLDKTTVTLEKGNSTKITATVLPASATKATAGFYTSDPGVAIVDDAGNITAVNVGSCTITSKSYDGKKSATCQVTVSAANEISTEQTPTVAIPSTVKVGALSYTYSNGEMTVSKIDATSSVSIPATVTVNGNVVKVTKIAKNACKGNKKITKVVIGNNITEIGAAAFSGCPKLKKVTIGTNTSKIGAKAFYNCKSLSSVAIKSTALKSVGSSAFKKLTENTKITVPKVKKKAYTKLLTGKFDKKTVIK